MVEDIKNELSKRKEEQRQLKQKIKNEKQSIKEKRERESQNFLHKNKTLHKIISNVEEKKDENHIERFIEEERSKLANTRAQRKKELIRANRSQIILFCIAVIVILAAVIAIICAISSHNAEVKRQEEQAAAEALKAQMRETYENAIGLILDEKYVEAEVVLNDVDYQDSSKLLQYVQLMQIFANYTGKSEELLLKLEDLAKFDDTEAEKQRKKVCNNVEQAADIQKRIDAINSAEVDLSIKDRLTGITQNLETLDPKYQELVDTKKYDLAVKTVENLEQNNTIGQLIVAIRGIGTVSLDSESQLNELKTKYDALNADEKAQVVNYTTLSNARTTLDKLKKEKQEADEKAAKEAAEQAEKERQEREREEAWYNSTVFITPTGNCYHYDGCSTISSSATAISRREAINRGYAPCGVCHSGGRY